MRELISETNFGRVERFQHTDGNHYAVKFFAPRAGVFTADELVKLKQRFAREVKVQRELDSTMFIPIVNADVVADPPWFIMPLAEKTLTDHFPAMRADNNEMLKTLGQILDALALLHSLGYVHRDLKPANILLHQGRWKLSDFGLVLPAPSGSTKLSSTMSAWGTRDYCAPEQTVEFGKVTAAADIYAFGCILHDLFDGNQRVPHLRQTCFGPLGAIIERCTETKPEKRFKSLNGLREAIFGVLAMQPRPILNAPTSRADEQLAVKVSAMETMSDADIEELAHFLNGLADPAGATQIFTAMNDERITLLHQRNPDAWQDFALKYCEWAGSAGFDWNYCDVLIERLARIFALGTVEVQATSMLAAARLGRGHNRFYVMNRVVNLCGPTLPDNVAHRIAIEILAAEAQDDFHGCATVVHRQPSEYHPRIAAAIPVVPPPPPIPTL
jgi:eukaryotic-like serine/threonine-protein kinase